MTENNDKDQQSLTEKLHRVFSRSEDGEDALNSSAADETPKTETDPSGNEKAAGEKKSRGCSSQPLLPQVNFPTFVASIAQSAMVQLGMFADPITGKVCKDLDLAKQTIDILGMLEEKTKGNLTSEEANMLKGFLYDLRIAYVKERH